MIVLSISLLVTSTYASYVIVNKQNLFSSCDFSVQNVIIIILKASNNKPVKTICDIDIYMNC